MPARPDAGASRRRAFAGRGFWLGIVFAVLAGAVARAQTPVDLELILAVDASGSVDPREYALQMSGIAAAFRDDEVIAAIQSGPLARIGVAVVIWSESRRPKDLIPWQVVSDRASAATFAHTVETHPRNIPDGGTGIGRAVLYAISQFDRNALTSERQVIDVSGDGRETTFREFSVPPAQARSRAISRGITVNGLAILTDDSELTEYYRREVVGGTDAFAMSAASYDDFAVAMRRKLIREIDYRPIISRLSPQ